MFAISKNSLYRGSIPCILLQLWLGHRKSFVISRTSLNRGSLNRGSTVLTELLITAKYAKHILKKSLAIVFKEPTVGSEPGGGTWVFFGWVCAALDSKLAPRSKKISPKIDTPF